MRNIPLNGNMPQYYPAPQWIGDANCGQSKSGGCCERAAVRFAAQQTDTLVLESTEEDSLAALHAGAGMVDVLSVKAGLTCPASAGERRRPRDND
jgi:hypothetical protein